MTKRNILLVLLCLLAVAFSIWAVYCRITHHDTQQSLSELNSGSTKDTVVRSFGILYDDYSSLVVLADFQNPEFGKLLRDKNSDIVIVYKCPALFGLTRLYFFFNDDRLVGYYFGSDSKVF